MHVRKRYASGLALMVTCTLALALATGMWATGARAHNHDRDMAERLQAMGEVLPLQDILARIAQDYPGQVLEVEFEDDDDHCERDSRNCATRWLYELKLLQHQGRLVKLKVDARTGQILKASSRPLRGKKDDK